MKPAPESFMVKAMVKAYELNGIEVRYFVSGGSGDNNIFSGMGLNCSGISTGMNAVHTTEEYLLMDDFKKAFDVMYTILTDPRVEA